LRVLVESLNGRIRRATMNRLAEGELALKLWILHRWKGTPINAAPDEHETIGWFAFSEARALELAHESYFNLIERIFRSNP